MTIISVDLTPYYGLLKISGADASSFLQGQLTCDIGKSSSQEFLLGGHCNLKGRLRALFRIFKENDVFFLQAPKSLLDFALTELKRYARFSKVNISHENEESSPTQIIGLIGINDISQFLAELPVSLNPEISIVKIPHFQSDSQNFQAGSQTRYEIIGSTSRLQNFLTILPNISKVQNFESWKLADIRDGLPEVWSELSEQLLPHYIHLPKLKAVSFTKGCYCGQEIIARMEYRGNIKKGMIRASMANSNQENILPGTRIYLDPKQRGLPQDLVHNPSDPNPSDHNPTEMGLVISTAITEEGNIEILLEVSEIFFLNNRQSNEFKVHLGSISNPAQKLLLIN